MAHAVFLVSSSIVLLTDAVSAPLGGAPLIRSAPDAELDVPQPRAATKRSNARPPQPDFKPGRTMEETSGFAVDWFSKEGRDVSQTTVTQSTPGATSGAASLLQMLSEEAPATTTPPGQKIQEYSVDVDGTKLDYRFLQGWDFRQRRMGRKDCAWNLSQVTDEAVIAAVAHFPAGRTNVTSPELTLLQSQRTFVAVHLHQATEALPRWTLELMRLLMALRRVDAAGAVDNLFVSIVESQSTLKSRRYIKSLEGHLTSLGVPFTVVRGKQFQTNTKSADFFAKARNKALEPLRDTSQIYDRVIMLQARYFCADSALQALLTSQPTTLGGLGAVAVCGMDYNLRHDYWGSHCIYGNVREGRDMTGQGFQASKPVTGMNEQEYNSNRPFQVFSCWAGLVVLSADIFQKQQLLFRTSRVRLSECPTSESELFFRDMWKVGRGNAIILPSAGTGVSSPAFQKCALRRQPLNFNVSRPLEFAVAPDTVNCCPLNAGDLETVDSGKCFAETWDRFGQKVPRYRTSPLSPTLLIDGDVTFLLSKGLSSSDMAADAANERLALVFALTFVIGLMTERLRFSQGSTTLLVALVLCAVSSLAMHVINKVAISVLPLPFTLVAIQMTITVLTMLACCDAKAMFKEMRSDPSSLKQWSMLTLPYVGVLVTMMFAIDEGTVTTMLLVRNTLPVVSTILERVFCSDGGDALTVQSCLSLYCVALGTLICTIYDLKNASSLLTIGWIALNMALTLIHRICQRRLLLDPRISFSCSSMTLVTNTTGLFIVLPLCFLYHESRMWFSPRVWSTLLGDPSAPACILLSGCVAASLGYYSVVAQKQASATCLLVLQTCSKMVTMTLSMLIFSVSWYWSSLLGCAISLAGCAWYISAVVNNSVHLDDLGTSKKFGSKGDHRHSTAEGCK